MDEKTAELLEQWGLAEYAMAFEENEIDYDVLIHLPTSAVEKLFSGKIGPAAIFQRKLQEHLLLKGNGSKTKEPSDEIKLEDVHMGADEWSDKVTSMTGSAKQDNSLPLEKKNNTVKAEELLSLPNIFGEEVTKSVGVLPSLTESTISSGKPTELGTGGPASSKRPLADLDSVSCPPEKRRLENVLETLFKNNCFGRALLRLSKTRLLEPANQVRLCHEIVVAEIGADACKVIPDKRLEELAEGIVAVFPMEEVQSYFIPPEQAQGAVKPGKPKGILFDRYFNLLRFLKKTGLRTNLLEENESDKVDS